MRVTSTINSLANSISNFNLSIQNVTFPHSSKSGVPTHLSWSQMTIPGIIDVIYVHLLLNIPPSSEDCAVDDLLLLLGPSWQKSIRKIIKTMSYSITNHTYWFSLQLIYQENKLIFSYLKTRCCQYYTLNIVYIKQHNLNNYYH